MIWDGMNLGFFAFRQFLVYGWYSGSCTLTKAEGKTFKVEIPKSYGFVEYVYSKW